MNAEYTNATRAIETAIQDYRKHGDADSHVVNTQENFLNTRISGSTLETLRHLLRKEGSRWYINLAPYHKANRHVKKSVKAKEPIFSSATTHQMMKEHNVKEAVMRHPMTADNLRKKVQNSAMASAMINAAYGRTVS